MTKQIYKKSNNKKMNYRNKNKISDKEILNAISNTLHCSIKNIANEIGVKPERLYEVSSHGRNKLSKIVIRRMLDAYKNINPEFIEFGEGSVLIDSSQNTNIEILHKKIDYLTEMVAELLKNQNK